MNKSDVNNQCIQCLFIGGTETIQSHLIRNSQRHGSMCRKKIHVGSDFANVWCSCNTIHRCFCCT